MAKIALGPIVQDARNKVANSVFTRNRGGAMIRKKVSPAQPRTARQTNVRASFSTLSKAWGGTLTEAQRLGWDALAAANPVKDVFGNSVPLTGLQMYQRLNQALIQAGHARIDDPPAALSVAGLTTLSAAAAAGAATFTATFTPTPVPALTVLQIYATAQASPGRASFGGKYRFIQNFAAAVASPADIKAAYVAKFGALITGKKIGVGAVQVDVTTGARTKMTTVVITVAA